MLGGFVFLSHQVGTFLGVWLGGQLYDATGSYDVVWWIAVALGVFAALVNLPVRERAIAAPGAAGMKPSAADRRGAGCGRRRGRAGGGVRGLPAARPRGRPRQPALGLLLSAPAHEPRGGAAVALGRSAGRT